MPISSHHPEYDVKLDDWRQMRDTYAGQRVVKQAGTLYLPPTTSMVLDGALKRVEPGYSTYQAYVQRAIYPDLVENAVSTMVGLLMKSPTDYQVPTALEPILERATNKGESIAQLHRRICEAQLLTGRIGLLLDVAQGASIPHIVSYEAEGIVNWDDSRVSEGDLDTLQFVVVCEETQVRGPEAAAHDYAWTPKTIHRVFELNGTYQSFTTDEDSGLATDPVEPKVSGRPLDFIPWTFINASDLVPSPGKIPLLGTSNAALSIYCGEADFRQTLHMTGQDTLVLIGVTSGTEDEGETRRVGANAVIELPEGGDAKYIGVNGEGLNEQRQALLEDYKRAMADGARLLENTAAQAESGEALKVRVAAKTTTLHSIAMTAAAGLEQCLKQAAIWVGADPEEVNVVPNTDFIEDSLPPDGVMKIIESKNSGLPLSYRTLHTYLQDNDYTTNTFEDEIAEIANEAQVLETLRKSAFVQDQSNEAPGTTERNDA